MKDENIDSFTTNEKVLAITLNMISLCVTCYIFIGWNWRSVSFNSR